MRVAVEEKVLSENDKLAIGLRERFRTNKVFCVNLISSPGSGKTALLERTLEALPKTAKVAVLTGDIQTENDARRLARAGFPVKQITTGGTCHLDASMLIKALADWDLAAIDILFVENVGNLVCPTSYDLGEHADLRRLRAVHHQQDRSSALRAVPSRRGPRERPPGPSRDGRGADELHQA
jgi:hydrogenase nickel incorporation protein HypB